MVMRPLRRRIKQFGRSEKSCSETMATRRQRIGSYLEANQTNDRPHRKQCNRKQRSQHGAGGTREKKKFSRNRHSAETIEQTLLLFYYSSRLLRMRNTTALSLLPHLARSADGNNEHEPKSSSHFFYRPENRFRPQKVLCESCEFLR